MTIRDKEILNHARRQRWEDIDEEALRKKLSCDEARAILYRMVRDKYHRAEAANDMI